MTRPIFENEDLTLVYQDNDCYLLTLKDGARLVVESRLTLRFDDERCEQLPVEPPTPLMAVFGAEFASLSIDLPEYPEAAVVVEDTPQGPRAFVWNAKYPDLARTDPLEAHFTKETA